MELFLTIDGKFTQSTTGHAHAYTHMYTCIKIANGQTHGAIHFDMLSLHLNHLIASHTGNNDWPCGTLHFGIFWSNLDTRDIKTYHTT